MCTLEKQQKMVITTSKKAHVINLCDIEYLQSNHCYTEFHVKDKQPILSSKPIKYYEDIMADKNFIRIHKQYIVNALHIKEILSGIPIKVVLSSGLTIPVTKLKKSELLKHYLL